MIYVAKKSLLQIFAILILSLLLSGPSSVAYANESSDITEKILVIKGGKPGASISIHQLNAFGSSGTVAKCKSPCRETVKLADPFYITIPTRRNKFETYLRRNSSEAEVKDGVYHFDITPGTSEEEATHYYRSFSSDVNNLSKRQDCFNFTKADLKERPKSCFKNPAMLPARMERSGWCVVRFKVLPNGASEDVTVSDCTEDMFRLPSLEAAKLFRYYPRLLGEDIVISKVKTKVKFDLLNERGDRILARGEGKSKPANNTRRNANAIEFETTPAKAFVTVTDPKNPQKPYMCETPCELALAFGKKYDLKIEKTGFVSVEENYTFMKRRQGRFIIPVHGTDYDIFYGLRDVKVTLRSPEEAQEKRDHILAAQAAYDAEEQMQSDKTKKRGKEFTPLACESYDPVDADKDAQPLVVDYPKAIRGKHENGHCMIRFNANQLGKVTDRDAFFCTDRVFKKSSLDSIKGYIFDLPRKNGKPAALCGVERKVSFRFE